MKKNFSKIGKISLLAALSTSVYADTVTVVTTETDGDPYTGASFRDGKCNLREAVEEARHQATGVGTDIEDCDGKAFGEIQKQRIVFAPDVKKALISATLGPINTGSPEIFYLTIDGVSGRAPKDNVVISGNDETQLFRHVGSNAQLTLNRMILTGGKADIGGITLIESGKVISEHGIFVRSCARQGGAVANSGGHFIAYASVFLGNGPCVGTDLPTTSIRGGHIVNLSGTTEIYGFNKKGIETGEKLGEAIYNNPEYFTQMLNGGSGQGGALACVSGNCKLKNVRIARNTAALVPPATNLFQPEGKVNIRLESNGDSLASPLQQGLWTDENVAGGGIAAYSPAIVTIEACLFEKNEVVGDGGGIFSGANADVSVKGSVFKHHSSFYNGESLPLDKAPINFKIPGGGTLAAEGKLDVTRSTISGSWATHAGSVLYRDSQWSSVFTNNTVVDSASGSKYVSTVVRSNVYYPNDLYPPDDFEGNPNIPIIQGYGYRIVPILLGPEILWGEGSAIYLLGELGKLAEPLAIYNNTIAGCHGKSCIFFDTEQYSKMRVALVNNIIQPAAPPGDYLGIATNGYPCAIGNPMYPPLFPFRGNLERPSLPIMALSCLDSAGAGSTIGNFIVSQYNNPLPFILPHETFIPPNSGDYANTDNQICTSIQNDQFNNTRVTVNDPSKKCSPGSIEYLFKKGI